MRYRGQQEHSAPWFHSRKDINSVQSIFPRARLRRTAGIDKRIVDQFRSRSRLEMRHL